MIIGVGTDLVSIDRMAVVLARHGDRFINRCFAVEEQWTSTRSAQNPSASPGLSPTPALPLAGGGDRAVLADRAAHYAKRWAAKEAVAKALGLGIDAGVYLRDIVVLRDARGAPHIECRNGAARVLQERCHLGTSPLFPPPFRGGQGGDVARDDRIRVHLSLSDDGGMALAFVVVEVLSDDQRIG